MVQNGKDVDTSFREHKIQHLNCLLSAQESWHDICVMRKPLGKITGSPEFQEARYL